MKSNKEDKFYKKYPHVVLGSVRAVKVGSKVRGGFKATHGRVCQIKCVVCGKTRMINVQDAFQVNRCAEHQLMKAKAKAATHRK